MTQPTILFFSRGYQAQYFPELRSDRYRSLHVTLTRAERRIVERKGGEVVGCFEEEYDRIAAAPVPENYLLTSPMSDRFLGRFPFAKRREILGKEIAFWSGILEKYTPVAVFNELIAIEISEVLLIETRRRGVRYLAAMNCAVDDYFYWLRDPMSLSGRHLEERIPSEKSAALARSYVASVLERNYKPFYVRNLRGRLNPFAFGVAVAKLARWKLKRALAAVTGRFIYELYDDEYGKKVAVYLKSLVLGYDSLAKLPAGSEVIFYPLHQEPEATLNYMSEYNANQVGTIENILKCMTPNQVLVVKEHPVDKGSLLRAKFRELRQRCSGLYYLPGEISGREVLTVASRVVTLTSTVGWESAVAGGQVYVLGQIFYDSFEGVTPIDGFDALKAALRLPAHRVPPRVAETEKFVASMTEQSYPGNPFAHDGLYNAANHKLVIAALAEAANIR
jgi:hypothetical protein